ncbi:RNA-guided endonuclease InsQ/TnpB family protein [Nocardia sp. NPDC060259]|uniref:RNA-guided endonuclease InsQ/TnpB family protein n=1 Tax=Nocardia sp. NPDC060259 TaxID=3347088 RepID=UPI003651AB38
MQLVVVVKLLPTPEQAAALAGTLRTTNTAATWLAEQAQTAARRGRTELQRKHYSQVKAVGLSAQPALHVIRKVADAYTTRAANLIAGNYGPKGSRRRERVESSPIRFRPDAAQPFDDRCLSWQYDTRTVSIWTTAGRMKNLCFTGSADHLQALQLYRQGETDLVHRKGVWFLYATCDIPEPETPEPAGWIGVDLGLANIATTSTGYRAAGRALRRHRERQQELRRKLQAKGTRAAKRVLKRQRRKESRRAIEINHQISKRIVVEAQRTAHGIGLEVLTGIRERVRLRKPQRAALHSWGFHQLGSFIEYKARRAGVVVVFVDAAYTSQTCRKCGHTGRANRPNQARFCCRACGFVEHADRNASHNIAARAAKQWGSGAQSAAPTPT